FQSTVEAHRALQQETSERGILLGANPLKPSTTATTVRRTADGKPLITDGPFAETKEQLAGYYLLDCKDLDEAISYAQKIPLRCAAGNVGGVEIRPVMPFSEIQQALEVLMAGQSA
ncbi:MAG: YciI family protein, partial [Terriglobales bacterium]